MDQSSGTIRTIENAKGPATGQSRVAFAMFCFPDELNRDEVVIRDLHNREQKAYPLSKITDLLDGECLMRLWHSAVIIAVLLAIDLVSKIWIRANVPLYELTTLIPNLIDPTMSKIVESVLVFSPI